ncbi:MAG TPA: FxLYD domain-containing protein [Bryobacteraceae bacterium]|nr:FxLYD domain-containing protein [Bryobacteraceae bacterium]
MAADKNSPLLPIIGIVVLLMAAAGWWLLGRGGSGESRPVLTPEARGYLKHLALSEVQMQASESYLKQAVVEIEGKIGNKGDRVVKLVEINCVFHDAYGQVVLRERVAIAGRKTGALRPGETKNFRLAFDSIPESWNKQMPDLVIAQILFG